MNGVSKGFDRKAAEYFADGRRTVVGVTPNDDFTLTILFDNGERRLYDMRPLIQTGTVFAPLADLAVFRRVHVDEQHHIAWDGNLDLCSDACYMDSTPMEGEVI